MGEREWTGNTCWHTSRGLSIRNCSYRNEYLVAENRILHNPMTGRVRLTDGERKTLAEIGQTLAVFPKEVLLQGA